MNRQRACVAGAGGCANWTDWVSCADAACRCPYGSDVSVEQWGSAQQDEVRGLAIGSEGEVLACGITAAPSNASGATLYVAARYAAPNTSKNWIRQWGATGTNVPVGLALAPQGELFIASQASGMIDGKASPGALDGMLTRFAAAGTRDYSAFWGSSESEHVWALARHPSGAIYAVGDTAGNLEHANAGPEDAFLSKLGADGKLEWSKQWGNADRDSALSIAIDAAGDLYVGGMVDGRAHCRKLRPDGGEVWSHAWSSSGYSSVTGIALHTDGSVYAVGNTDGSLGGTGSGGIFISKLDAAQGNVAWTDQIGVAASDYARAVAVGPDGDAYFAAESSGSIVPGAAKGSEDVVVQRRRPNGTVVWSRQVGTAKGERVWALALGKDGSVFVGGLTSGAFPGFSSQGSADSFLIVVAPGAR